MVLFSKLTELFVCPQWKVLGLPTTIQLDLSGLLSWLFTARAAPEGSMLNGNRVVPDFATGTTREGVQNVSREQTAAKITNPAPWSSFFTPVHSVPPQAEYDGIPLLHSRDYPFSPASGPITRSLFTIPGFMDKFLKPKHRP